MGQIDKEFQKTALLLMKRCPECRRDYHDDTLSFCLADGTELVYGLSDDEPETAILSESASAVSQPTSAPTISRRNALIAAVAGTLLVTALGVGSYLFYGRASSKQIDSIAVMPFVNESGNADFEYLSDGMTEMLISSLSQLPNLNVRPRSSVFRYKGKETSPQAIGKELNVQAILNGRVVQRGQDLSLFVELIDVALDKVVWSQQYNRKQAELVPLQTEIARDVSSKLKLNYRARTRLRWRRPSQQIPKPINSISRAITTERNIPKTALRKRSNTIRKPSK